MTSSRRKFRGAIALTIGLSAVGLGACGSRATAAVRKVAVSKVAVSKACDDAMFALATASTSSGAPQPALDAAIVDACQTKQEWLTAVIPYTTVDGTGCVVCANADPNAVYRAMCAANADAPACRNAG